MIQTFRDFDPSRRRREERILVLLFLRRETSPHIGSSAVEDINDQPGGTAKDGRTKPRAPPTSKNVIAIPHSGSWLGTDASSSAIQLDLALRRMHQDMLYSYTPFRELAGTDASRSAVQLDLVLRRMHQDTLSSTLLGSFVVRPIFCCSSRLIADVPLMDAQTLLSMICLVSTCLTIGSSFSGMTDDVSPETATRLSFRSI